MKKSFSVYGLVWLICLGVFNVITFVTPNEIGGVSKFSGSFWVGYIFITVAFLGQLICAYAALRETNLNKLFYKVSLISISYGGLIAMLIAGSIFMAVPALDEWIGIIVCVVILAFNVISVIKASAAAAIVSGSDEKVKAQVFFIKTLTDDAQALMTCAKSDELRAEAKKVYEAFRYSDPMSSAALFEVEGQIDTQFAAFANAMKAGDDSLAKTAAIALIESLQKRNQKCKLLK